MSFRRISVEIPKCSVFIWITGFLKRERKAQAQNLIYVGRNKRSKCRINDHVPSVVSSIGWIRSTLNGGHNTLRSVGISHLAKWSGGLSRPSDNDLREKKRDILRRKRAKDENGLYKASKTVKLTALGLELEVHPSVPFANESSQSS